MISDHQSPPGTIGIPRHPEPETTGVSSHSKILYGAYGAGNLGDDLILKAALERHWKPADGQETSTRVVCYGPPRVKVLPPLILQRAALQDPDRLFGPDTSLHFCGGGLFWTAEHCDEMLHLAKSQTRAGGHVFVERIGTQGFHCAPDTVRELLGLASRVSVRDKNSADLLVRYGIYDKAIVEHDYVLCLTARRHRDDVPAGPPIVAINHSPTLFYSNPAHRAKVIRLYTSLARACGSSVRFVYLPMVRHYRCIEQNDVVVGEELSVGSGGLIETLSPFETVEDLLDYFPRLSAVIGWRYHLMVLAHLHRIPGCFVGEFDEHKYAAFAKENDMGLVDFNQDESHAIAALRDFLTRISA